jgi:hypothetical protein
MTCSLMCRPKSLQGSREGGVRRSAFRVQAFSGSGIFQSFSRANDGLALRVVFRPKAAVLTKELIFPLRDLRAMLSSATCGGLALETNRLLPMAPLSWRLLPEETLGGVRENVPAAFVGPDSIQFRSRPEQHRERRCPAASLEFESISSA